MFLACQSNTKESYTNAFTLWNIHYLMCGSEGATTARALWTTERSIELTEALNDLVDQGLLHYRKSRHEGYWWPVGHGTWEP